MFQIKESFIYKFLNQIYGIICKSCSKGYISEADRKLADRFREHHTETHNQNVKKAPFQVNMSDNSGDGGISTALNLTLIIQIKC